MFMSFIPRFTIFFKPLQFFSFRYKYFHHSPPSSMNCGISFVIHFLVFRIFLLLNITFAFFKASLFYAILHLFYVLFLHVLYLFDFPSVHSYMPVPFGHEVFSLYKWNFSTFHSPFPRSSNFIFNQAITDS